MANRVRLPEVVELAKARFFPLCRLMVMWYSIGILRGVVPLLALFAGGFQAVIPASSIYAAATFVFGVLTSLAPIVLTLEDRGVMSALKRSIALVRPALGRILVLHLLWVAVVFAAFFVTNTFAIVISYVFPLLSVFVYPFNFLVIVVAFPVFRTLQTLIYTDLLIREGTLQAGPLGRPVGLGANNSAEEAPAPFCAAEKAPFFATEPHHAARVAAGLAVLPVITDPPGIPWLIIIAGCLGAELYLRTRRVQWTSQIRAVLVQMRLARPPESSVAPSGPTGFPATPPQSAETKAAFDTPIHPPHVVVPPRTAPTEYAQFTPHQPQYARSHQPPSAQQFWQPPPPGGNTPSKDHPRRRGPLAIVAVVGVLALVVSSGAVWWLVNRDESMPAVEATGQLRNTYPAAPTATWAVDAGQIFSRAQFAAPIPSPTGSNTPGFIDLGDTLVTTAYLPQSDRDADLVAIDSNTGTVRWTTELGFDVSVLPARSTAYCRAFIRRASSRTTCRKSFS